MHDNDIKKIQLAPIPLAFEHFTNERDVNFYSGFSTIALFKTNFDHVAVKAHVMTYCERQQSHTTNLDKPKPYPERINMISKSPVFGPNDLPHINWIEQKKSCH